MTRRYSALVLSFLALLLTIAAWRTHRPAPTAEQLAYQRPLNQLLARVCPGSEVQVLSTRPLRLVGNLPAPYERRMELEARLHELLGPEAHCLLLPGRAGWRPDSRLLLGVAALLAAYPLWLGLGVVWAGLRRRLRPRRSWCLIPAVLGAGVLCLGWPLWLLVPGLLALLAVMRRSTPPPLPPLPLTGLHKAAVYFSLQDPSFTTACFKLLHPHQRADIDRATPTVPPLTIEQKIRVHAEFSVEVMRVRERMGVPAQGQREDPELAVRVLKEKYLEAPKQLLPRPRRKIFSCPVCDEVFISEDTMRLHQRAAHELPQRGRRRRQVVAVGLLGLAAFSSVWLGSYRGGVRELALPGSLPLTVPQLLSLEESERVLPRADVLVVRGRGGVVLAGSAGDLHRLRMLTGLPALAMVPPWPWPWLIGAQVAVALALLWPGRARKPEAVAGEPAPVLEAPAQPEAPLLGPTEDLSVELGHSLLGLVDPAQGAKFQTRLATVRRHMAYELGLPVGSVRFRDNLNLGKGEYLIRMREQEVARATLCVNGYLAIGPEEKLKSLPGKLVQDPTYGMPGKWITPERRGDSERLGCMIFDPTSVFATQLTDAIRTRAHQMLSFDQVEQLLNYERYRGLLRELEEHSVDRVVIWRVLRLLLAERVSIRDLLTILESLLLHAELGQDPEVLTEFARLGLAAQISAEYANRDKVLQVLCLDACVDLDGPFLLEAAGTQVRTLQERGLQPILLCSPGQRRRLYERLHRSYPSLVVLSWNEIAPGYEVNCISTITT